MGGRAFLSAGLHTPRMPPNIYYNVRHDVLTKLRTIYPRAEALLEAPGKVDHGDIDILVTVDHVRPNSAEVATLLSALKFLDVKGSKTVHYAVPWPGMNLTSSDDAAHVEQNRDHEALTDGIEDMPEHAHPPGDVRSGRYIQVDVNHSRSNEELNITKFMHAHGDMWLMISTMIRPYGLTCSDGGLHIRIPELESWDKKKSRVKLIENPDDILEYLGLDVESYWTPFASLTDCFEYVATCRFYDPRRKTAREEDCRYSDIKAEQKRSKMRSMFAHWLHEYLPQHQELAPGRAVGMTREDVLEEAKALFGAEFAERYEEVKKSGIHEQNATAMWADIRKNIPAEGGVLEQAMRGLRVQILTTTIEIDPALREAQQSFQDGHFDQVKQWSLKNWEEARHLQEERTKKRIEQILRE